MRLFLAIAVVLAAAFFLAGCIGSWENPAPPYRPGGSAEPPTGIGNGSDNPSGTLAIIPVEGAQCTVGEFCTSLVATASGGEPPYTFQSDSFATGAPPMGVIVGMDGTLSGTPSLEGGYNFGVCVKDMAGTTKCAQASVRVNPANGLDEHGCNRAAGEGWCGITETCILAGEACEAPPQPQGESWSGTLTGTYSEHNGNYAPCLGNGGGAYSESFTLSFTTDSPLADALQGNSWASGTGTFSGQETVSRSPSESYCRLQPSSANSQVDINAKVDSYSQKAAINIRPSDMESSLWASSSSLSGTHFGAGHGEIILQPTAVSASEVSGNWHSSFGASGTFTLHRAG